MVGYDWYGFYTPQEAERQLKGFSWKGPGWYTSDTDTLYVEERGTETQRYQFFVWSRLDGRQWVTAEMLKMLSATVHQV